MEKQYSAKIREIFTSIQGEGPYVGQKQIFVRFCKCNLNCEFCDTDFEIKKAKEYSTQNLYEKLKDNDCEIISFTGGEPLKDVEFLIEFLTKYKNKLNKKIYLETNGTLSEELSKIIDLIDVVAMDVKIESATKQKNNFILNDNFLNIAKKKETFIKIVFDENIKNNEIENCNQLSKKYNVRLILQPKMPMSKNLDIEKIFNKFYKENKNIRLIPQVHKYLNLA